MCVCVRLSNVKVECDRLKQAADDQSNQPERLTELLTEMRDDRDKVVYMLVKLLFILISLSWTIILHHLIRSGSFRSQLRQTN